MPGQEYVPTIWQMPSTGVLSVEETSNPHLVLAAFQKKSVMIYGKTMESTRICGESVFLFFRFRMALIDVMPLHLLNSTLLRGFHDSLMDAHTLE